MEIRVKTKSGRTYRSTAYIEGAFSMKIFYPEVWNYADARWEKTGETFMILPFSQIVAISGRGKAKEFMR